MSYYSTLCKMSVHTFYTWLYSGDFEKSNSDPDRIWTKIVQIRNSDLWSTKPFRIIILYHKENNMHSPVPWRCVPERSVPVTIRPLDFCNDPSPGRPVPWTIRPLEETSPGRNVPWTKRPLDETSPGRNLPWTNRPLDDPSPLILWKNVPKFAVYCIPKYVSLQSEKS
jgi:hypothetical protein